MTRQLFFFLFVFPTLASAQENSFSELTKQFELMKSQLSALQNTVAVQNSRIAALEQENNSLKSTPLPGQGSAIAPTSPQNLSTGRDFTPQIGVVADIVGTSTQSDEDEEGNDRISLRELEIIFEHDIDPYSKLRSTVTFSDSESPDVEEAFVSFHDLPFYTAAQLGRFRPKLGIASAGHRDALPSVDEPLVVQRYLGPEGLFKTGVELTNYLPFSWDNPAHQITVGILEGGVGEEGQLLGESGRRPTLYTRVRNSYEFTDESSFDIGGTYLRGSSDDDSKYEVNLFEADLAFIQHLSPVNRLLIQTEIFFQDRSEGLSIEENGEPDQLGSENNDFRAHPYGLYGLIDYRLSKRFGIGTRFDYVEPVNRNESQVHSAETAYNGMITYYQSEFARWRFQYQYVEFPEGDNDNRFFLQGIFAIGAHSHQLQ